MKQEFYFASIPAGGTASIFIEMFVARNQAKNFVKPCRVDIKHENHDYYPMYIDRAPYVAKIEDSLQTGFRSVNWIQHFDLLENSLKENQPLSMWFASFNKNVVEDVKKKFKHDVTTISINYNHGDYDFLIDKWARWQAGMIFRKAAFQDIKNKFSTVSEAKKYCLDTGPEQFGYSIPRSKVVQADYMINLTDLYNQEKISVILTQLEFSCTDDDWSWYRHYIKHSG